MKNSSKYKIKINLIAGYLQEPVGYVASCDDQTWTPAKTSVVSARCDSLGVLEPTVDFEYFREWLVEGLGYGDGSKGGRPPFDLVSMFKALILQAQHNLSDKRMEFMIRDRLSWMRFLGFELGGSTPDENTIRHFRN
ncbi:MAG: transposase, partial [Flavobacteriaceae bacterium]|nr:transposase [Flavobacteriaceae bacterium]